MKLYGIQFKDGKYQKFTGSSIQEAFSQTEKKLENGNLDFSQLDFYLVVPTPVILGDQKEFQVFLMRNKKSNWEPAGEISPSFSATESLMKLKVKLEGFFSGIVVDMRTEKPVSWIWSV